jgi:hypothetical protein
VFLVEKKPQILTKKALCIQSLSNLSLKKMPLQKTTTVLVEKSHNGMVSVNIRYTLNKKQERIPLPAKVLKEHWIEQKQCINSNHPDSFNSNKLLSCMLFVQQRIFLIVKLMKKKNRTFIAVARTKRAFPFEDNATIIDVLTHLNLIDGERITNAAILLFGKNPQRFFLTSEIKCAHFHGLTPTKPIPSYQVYKGDVFEMIEKVTDFILSKINLYVGTRDKSSTVNIEYLLKKQNL